MKATPSLIRPTQRVLLVDDEAGTTALCRWILERSGKFVVREENNSLQALETARAFRPQLIFIDHHMPGKRGDELADEITADSGLQDIPIVFLTGDINVTTGSARHPVLLKPVRAANLLEACATHMEPPAA